VELRVRPAQQDDLMLTFEWYNDPLTRKMDFDQAPASLETHREWFRRVLTQRGKFLMIVEGLHQDEWIPIGQVRVDDGGEISMSLAPQCRGQHLATPAIMAAMAHVQGNKDMRVLTAHIKQENSRSAKAFEGSGFRCVGPTTVRGHECLEYRYGWVE
jgi:UDP-2,4-diacetamido-2,4,6-trideoxy-beta-L-altropyranose hydrolase